MALAKNTSEEELKELKKWQKIEELNVELTLKRFIDNEEVVTKRELIELWKVDRKTVERYIKKGMPVHRCSQKGFQIFPLKKDEEWRDENINKSQSLKASKKEVPVDIESGKSAEEDKEIDSVSTEEAERRLKIKENKIKEFKLKELSGEFVKSDTSDKVTAEFGATFIGWLVNSRETLSGDLAHKSKGEIFEILDFHYGKFIKDIGERLNDDVDEESMTIFEIIYLISFKLEDYKEKIFKVFGIK